MKAKYVKPALEVFEIEVMETLMNGSKNSMGFGGGTTSEDVTENYSRQQGFWD